MKTEALIFDLDGVLTDTAEYHYQAWKTLSDRLGLTFDREDNERLKGVSRLRSLEIILEINGKSHAMTDAEKRRAADLKNEEYGRLIRQIRPTDILPGINDLLSEARKAGLKLAVASASRNARTVLQGLQLTETFDYIADADHIRYTKPDPEVFLDCAGGLHVSPLCCIGFEDSQAGIEALHAAGMMAVGINVHVTSEAPDLIVQKTGDLVLGDILRAAAEFSPKKKERASLAL